MTYSLSLSLSPSPPYYRRFPETSVPKIPYVASLLMDHLGIPGFYPYKRICPKVSGLVAWSENCKWYNSPPLDSVVSLFRESV
jgi:hypothetical protein